MSNENELNRSNKSGIRKSGLKIFGIIILILAVILGLYFGVAYIIKKLSSEASTATTQGKIADQNLVGTWETDCLVPDPESKWAEKHKFIINKDGTATHTRQDWEANDCTTLEPAGTITDQFKLTVPLAGKINLSYTDTKNTRMTEEQADQFPNTTIYDIYKISDNTLKFGHGFRGDSLAYGSKTGSSEGDRFNTLNNFIVYKKQ